MSRKLGAVLAAAVMTLAACGGGGGRPSADEISAVFQEGGEIAGEDFSLPKDQADCVAKAYHESDISDEALNAIVEKDEDYEASEKDTKALEAVSSEKIAKCMGLDMGE